jgi:hypothetical protein
VYVRVHVGVGVLLNLHHNDTKLKVRVVLLEVAFCVAISVPCV